MHGRKGIVLKQFTNSYKIAILDDKVGRVDAISTRTICVGSLVSYHVDRQRGSQLFLSHTSITYLPFSLARADVLFWHHVLELCYYFVPVGSYPHDLFELLEFVYTVDNTIEWTIHAKKLYLLKMLITIGWNIELTSDKEHVIQTLVHTPPALLVQKSLHKEQEHVVDEWLALCIAEHPSREKFKTVQFLVTNRRI